MRKLLSLILILLLSVTLYGCSTNNEKEPVLLAPNGDYKHELFDNCVIMGGSINDSLLYYNNEIIYKGSFFKYSAFDNRYVAIHNMELVEAPNDSDATIKFSMDTVKINKSCFIIFDSENQSVSEFENIETFNDECFKKSLNFDNWYYRETKSERITITDNCYIEDAGDYRGQLLYYNNVPIFEGIISSYEFDNDCLGFEFKIVDSDYGPEFPEITNQNLNKKKFQTSKKHRVEGLLFYDVTYEAYIVFNTKTGNYQEYKSKNDYLNLI